MNTTRTAVQFDRNTLDINGSARDALIFDLQNTADVLENHGQNVRYLCQMASDLSAAAVWNADELTRLVEAGCSDVHAYHGALRRSLAQKF
jgi:hypothetical protein